MSAVFESLPGIDVPVGEIKPRLDRMWEDPDLAGEPMAEDSARAMQLNYVLHFGFATAPADARQQFETIKDFSRRYPCRVVILCPLPPDDPATRMRAKIYGECFLGKSRGDAHCVEFVMLDYPEATGSLLENQVSICLATDLPTYYWAHRFADGVRLADYDFLLSHAHRVIFDTSIMPARTCPWPRPERVRDLVGARLLPVRQSLGQFLSGFEPARLVTGLQAVKLYHQESYAPEARVLLDWLRVRLQNCGLAASCDCVVQESRARGIEDFAVEFCYRGDRYFKWRAGLAARHAEFAADMGQGRVELTTTMHLLEPVAALAEATFHYHD